MEDVSRMGLNAPSTLQIYKHLSQPPNKTVKKSLMDAENIEKIVKRAKDDIMKEVSDRLPRKVGVVAVNHFKQNFRDGG